LPAAARSLILKLIPAFVAGLARTLIVAVSTATYRAVRALELRGASSAGVLPRLLAGLLLLRRP
jgi:hypothetical protein